MARRGDPPPYELLLTAKTPKGNVSYTRLAVATNGSEAKAMFHALERKLAAQLPEADDERAGWVAIYLDEDGNHDEKGTAFLGTKAQAKKILGGRVRVAGPAPRNGRPPPAPRRGTPGIPADHDKAYGRWSVLVETAKGTGRKVAQAFWASTKAEAERKAYALLKKIEDDVRDQRYRGAPADKVRVEVVNQPTNQITMQSRWVKT